MLSLFLSLLLVFIGIKIGKPIIKYALLILGLLLVVGFLIPGW